MQAVIASAPGKAVLSGEYAVLHGAAAIAVAVDRRARVTVRKSGDERHVIDAPGYLPGKWHFTVDNSKNFNWQEALPDASAFALVEAVWHSFDIRDWPPMAIEIDTRALCDDATGLKLGLGSSAAVAVALAAALKSYCEVDRDFRATAFDAHDRFQQGRGSGVDVAISHDGGLIAYRRAGRESRQLGWPVGLHYRFLWSGQAADTKELLADLGDREAGNEKSNALTGLIERSEELAAAFSLGDARRILESYPACVDALERFSEERQLGVFGAGHGKLARAANNSEVVYKPCGAGGGDIGIVLGACEHEVDEFCELAGKQKFSTLDLAIDEQGVLFAE